MGTRKASRAPSPQAPEIGRRGPARGRADGGFRSFHCGPRIPPRGRAARCSIPLETLWEDSMESFLTWLEPSLASPCARPERLASPFDAAGPHPLARDAARALMSQLREGTLAPGLTTDVLSRPEGGKM